MKKIKLLGLILMVSMFSYAQEFIQINETFEIKGVKIFKGEIFELKDKNTFLFGQEELPVANWKYSEITDIKEVNNIISKSENFDFDITKYYKENETIKIINAYSTEIDLKVNGVNTFKVSDIGNKFRIVIPGHKTFFYEASANPNNESQNIVASSEADNSSEEGFINKLPKWSYYLLGMLLVLFVSGIIYIIFYKKNGNTNKPILVEFKGNSMQSFADYNKINVEDLFKWNKVLRKYKKINEENEKKIFRNNLVNKKTKLVVGFADNTTDSFAINDIQNNNQNNNKSDQFSVSEITTQINNLETKLIREINNLSANRSAAAKVEELERDLRRLKENEEKLKVNAEQLEKNNILLKTEVDKIANKYIEVEFLENHARSVIDLFNLANSGYKTVNELYEKMSIQDPENAVVIAQLLMKFNASVPSKIGNWEEILKEIQENKISTNAYLIKSFKQIQSKDEKLAEFKRILLKEVIEKYASALLIVGGELSKLSKFTNNRNQLIAEIEANYVKWSAELQSKLKMLGIDLNNIPLFENYEAYAANIVRVNQQCSLPYKKINNLEKETVLEIVNYGFGNDKTKIILT